MRTLREVVDMRRACSRFPPRRDHHTKERNEDRFGRKRVWSSAAAVHRLDLCPLAETCASLVSV
jgi:hypothetical protein